jgi:hypothetical protein
MTAAPSACAGVAANEPLKAPTAVRAAAAITISLAGILELLLLRDDRNRRPVE